MSDRSIRRWLSAVLLGLGLVSSSPHSIGSPGQSSLRQVTLYSRIGHNDQDYGRSGYNFYALARSDKSPRIIRNRMHLLYGSVSINGDSDWFSVATGRGELSRIKDLGQMKWIDVSTTPVIPTPPYSTEGIRAPAPGQPYEESSEGRVTQIIAEHIYVLHIKNAEEDFYVMVRVDALAPGDYCTISWRVVQPAVPKP